ncbi:MAG: hypothetical protein ACYDH9_01830 [Limisphaerales bacterium]
MINYYSHPDVRARMLEFLGGHSPGDVTCHFLTAGDTTHDHHRHPRPVEDLAGLWETGREISRSLWDRKALIADLAVEYVNFEAPSEPYLEPEHAFHCQRPVEWATEAVLLDYGIAPLHLLTGQGHHFVWRIRRPSGAFLRLAELGRVSTSLNQYYARPHPPDGHAVAWDSATAFAGLGLVMEYLAHRVKELAEPMCETVIGLTAVDGYPVRRGRELVSIDLSEYGDPLTAPVIRVPFSIDLKPWQQRSLLGPHLMESLPPFFLIPLGGLDSGQGIQIMREPSKVVHLAGQVSARIPDQSKPMGNLIAAYRCSELAGFHDWFYSQEHAPRERWPVTYDRTPSRSLPGCARYILDHPNDLLLQSAGIERIVRVMLSLGWHPRQVAGLIRSKYERDFGWGDQWQGFDAAARADFCTRVIAGLIAVGRDDLAGEPFNRFFVPHEPL